MSEVKITWLGHACFRMEYRGWSLVTDPYIDDMVPGLPPLRTAADAVYCSHEHDDHNARGLVKLTRQAPPPDFRVEEFVCPHDDAGGALRGMNTVRIFRFGPLRAAHLGDIGCMPGEELLAALTGCDLLLTPIGGYYTIDARTALDIVDRTTPRAVVPMHYRSGRFGFPVLDTLEGFAAAFGERILLPGAEFTLTETGPRGLVIPGLP